jgi:hypothetical protein
MKLLNLDELALIQKSVTIKGVDYEVVEQTLGGSLQDINLLKEAKAQAGDETEDEIIVKNIYKAVRRLIPSAPEEVVAGLTFKQAFAVLDFVTNDGKTDEKSETQSEAESQDAEKKS